ncbi:aKG-HExxH-type peptide beta-hydroxylase [Delftia sp. HK171]|uniref:aKG-HExxH-type peptide beta-hydroxylase n=1 Tax=Delftia sp. HK171 TaxID=1920191 RepID=UPI0012EC5D4E|nr:HEXXH motif-containing putative peptide modification protein [Delftia sp. HK171]
MKLLSSLSFMNPAAIRRNLVMVKRYADQTTDLSNFSALQRLQHFPDSVFKEPDRHQRVKDSEVSALTPLLAGIMGGEFPPSFSTISDADCKAYIGRAVAGERHWNQLFPEDFTCYEELVRYVIYAYRDTYSGGSVSNAIGWIWLSPQADWTIEEYSENIIHEYTHNVLFLEEMVNTLFSVSASVMAEPENRVVSAIRRVPRFFDQTYHAAAVAIVLAEFAISGGRLKDARLLVHGLLPSLDAMKEKRALMTDNGYTLLLEMISRGLALYEEVSKSADSQAWQLEGVPA